MGTGFGAFGKIPALGDFIRLGLPSGVANVWDAWMQRVLLAAQDRLAERWSECYLSAPIWRFTLASGAVGERGLVGIVMPSVDRVGRRYPLTLGAQFVGRNAALVHFANRQTFENLEDLALSVLDEEIGRNDLAGALEKQDLRLPADVDCAPGRSPVMIYRDVMPEHALAAAQITGKHGDVCLWSAVVDREERLMLSRGLPDPVQATGLFDLEAPAWNSSVLEVVK
ncbi:type VI secretion system-associated protein TagF [Ostreiculturibacter nitratireducens]|uniref:type VI secretion system-associated protein TagF n=1 Tax=Ostreiculturibacter nitratireducens TaxID=3075226 RepID=UPI0031B5E666